MTERSFAYPRNQEFVETDRKPTIAFARSYEEVLNQLLKIRGAAEAYTELNTGTATTAQIATALNALVAAILET